MMRLHIFGASGSGVTTLGKSLSEELNLTYFDSDDYFWEKSNPPFTIRRDPEIRNKLISEELLKEKNWILGGSIINWGDDCFPPFDLVVFLWTPPGVRLSRLKQRELKRYGDVIYTDAERNKQFKEFIDWAEGYDSNIASGRTLAAHEAWLNKIHYPVLQIREDNTVEERVTSVLNKIKTLCK